MNLIDFNKKFPNEDACIEYFKAKRESQGIVCDKCGSTHHYWKSYRNQWQCKKCVKSHTSQVIEPKDISKVLPWVHIVIGNAKRQLLDIHHDIQTEFLQSYLDEFCYKFNRRNLDLFERLMTSCVEYKNEFKHRIYSKSA